MTLLQKNGRQERIARLRDLLCRANDEATAQGVAEACGKWRGGSRAYTVRLAWRIDWTRELHRLEALDAKDTAQ